MTFEKHLRSVSSAAFQRLGILWMFSRVFHDRLLLGWCFRGFVLSVLEYCSAMWCLAADTHLNNALLDLVISGASFITGGAFEWQYYALLPLKQCIMQYYSLLPLWQYYACCTRSGVTRYTLVMVLTLGCMRSAYYTRLVMVLTLGCICSVYYKRLVMVLTLGCMCSAYYTRLVVVLTLGYICSAYCTLCFGRISVHLCDSTLQNLAVPPDFYRTVSISVVRSLWPSIQWCGTVGFQEQDQCLFIGLATRSHFVSFCFPFIFIHSI